MTAADAGNVLLTGAAFHTQKHFAVRTFKILVVPAVFHALHKLTGFLFPV